MGGRKPNRTRLDPDIRERGAGGSNGNSYATPEGERSVETEQPAQITATPPSAIIAPASFCKRSGSSGSIQCAKIMPKIGDVTVFKMPADKTEADIKIKDLIDEGFERISHGLDNGSDSRCPRARQICASPKHSRCVFSREKESAYSGRINLNA
jgi:hypothetical protein